MPDERPHIRKMRGSDTEAVDALLTASFGRPDEARIVDTLRRGGDLAVGLVAELADAIAGVAILSQLRQPDGALGLGPIAVSEDARHRGVGGRLIEASVNWAEEAEASGIFVLGRPRYYTRHGFSLERAAEFSHTWPPDFMLALEIDADALPGDGPLVYPPAFAALG